MSIDVRIRTESNIAKDLHTDYCKYEEQHGDQEADIG